MKVSACLILCFASIVTADDFKTIEGKEYKNVTVSRVEPDGIVLMTKSGISKVYFTELPKEVQERFNHDAAKAAIFSAEQTASQEHLYKQRQESERQRVQEREKYWSEHRTPKPELQGQLGSSSTHMTGSALDRPAYSGSSGSRGGSISPEYLVSEYARNEIKADSMYKGRIFTLGGTIKLIYRSGDKVTVELFVPKYYHGSEVTWMNCVFNDSSELEQKTRGQAITLTGRLAGMRGNTLVMEDCHL